MKALWFTSGGLKKIQKYLNREEYFASGWIESSAEYLVSNHMLELGIAYKSQKEDANGKVEDVTFYSINEKNMSAERLDYILMDFQPDVIMVFGTEYDYQCDIIDQCIQNGYRDRLVVWLQGLVSVFYHYYYGLGVPDHEMRHRTFKELFCGRANMLKEKNGLHKRGVREKEVLSKVKYVIGRTDWDKMSIEAYYPDAEYFHCDETLRSTFYNNHWSISNCERHTVFTSSCDYPLKGFHYLIEAAGILKKKYPDIKIYCPGKDFTHYRGKDALRYSSYQLFLKKMIKKYNLIDNVIFVGRLSEKEMCDRFLKSHVFVLPSNIENSPNSLGEAMILGVPCIAADVGGVTTMMKPGEGFIYQSNAPYLISGYITRIFEDDDLATKMSEKAREHAVVTHDKNKNSTQLYEIYKTICDQL